MARRAVIRKKSKVIRKTKNETWLVNNKYLGDEPVLNDNYTQSEYSNALTWYHYMCSKDDAREYLETYLKNSNRAADAKKIKSVPDVWIPKTAAWVARIISRGGKVPQKPRDFLQKSLENIFSNIEKHTKVSPTDNPTVSIQQRMKKKADEILGEIENIVDERANTPDFSLYEWLKRKEIPTVYAEMIPQRYTAWLQELLDAISGVDKQLVEAYASVPKKKMEYDIVFFNMLIEDAERYADTSKKIRKPRKPRTISVEKKLSNLKYQKEDNTFKIASVSPEKIIGCNELWTFNTKYKTLTVLRALDRGGLQIKGTSIINYNENTSITKRTGRKSEYFIDRVLKGGKIVLKKLMDEMDKQSLLAYRINENTILLKVV